MRGIDHKLLSKTIAHALRHQPSFYGLELDAEGWADMDLLVEALHKYHRWLFLVPQDIEQMNAKAAKKRFEIKDGKIRAMYGHSSGVNISKNPTPAPEILYHGTSPENAELILKDGLKAMERQFVHLSADKRTAKEVGKRKADKPVVLEIEAARAQQAGVQFYLGNDTIWLADSIPSEFIKPAE